MLRPDYIEHLLESPFGRDVVYFREYRGPAPSKGWKRKPIVGPPDRPFAELQYLKWLEREGWIAGWCFRKREFIAEWEPVMRAVTFPGDALALLDRIDKRAEGKGACWDVFAWKDSLPQFFDLVRRGSGQRRSDSQNIWRDAALAVGVPKDAFREINWLGGSIDGYSLKAMSVVQGRVDGWARYRPGKPFEYGGEFPDLAARDWVEGYKRDTGLDGPDLLWVLFRDQSHGKVSYWNIEQRRER